MVSDERWRTAQAYEAHYWEDTAARIAAGTVHQLEWYGWRADQLAQRLRRLGLGHLADGSANVVEVGAGPIGVVTYFPAARRVAVDPLNDRYAADPVLVKLRDPAVEYLTGVGESLPGEDGAFQLAIIENCIDHVQNPRTVMRELGRVLAPDGILYLTVNCRSRTGYFVHRLLSRLKIDAGHPFTFTPKRAGALATASGFEVLDLSELQSYRQARAADLRSASARDRVKALLGVSEFTISMIARRASHDAR
jgi:SAM-dependent methyltransferase